MANVNKAAKNVPVIPDGQDSESVDLSNEQVVCVSLQFTATSPVCCPEIADKTNTIRSGFAIPASAVQGVILHRLRRENPSLADATFKCDGFIAWPLLPKGIGDGFQYSDPVRVGLTHRGAKYALGDDYSADHFQDEAIEPYDWKTVPNGSPLKAADGVLLSEKGKTLLWKAAAMPRVVTAHGVRNDQSVAEDDASNDNENELRSGQRNLFTVDSMAPLIWSGKVFLPELAAKLLIQSLNESNRVSFGKGRSVRGHGKLVASDPVTYDSFEWTGLDHEKEILVAQSPIEIPENYRKLSAEDALAKIVNDWISDHKIANLQSDQCWGTTSIRFGWNRTTRSTTKKGGFESATLVLDPGATIRLSRPLTKDERKHLRHGFGTGRTRGFGAVSRHPGKAEGLFIVEAEQKKKESDPGLKTVMQKAIEITANAMPTPSQWAALRNERVLGKEKAITYLNRQLERPSAIFAVWKDVEKETKEILNASDAAALAALTFLGHKAALRREEKSNDQ